MKDFSILDSMLDGLDLSVINEVLKKADQIVHSNLKEAKEEYKNCVLRYSQDHLAEWVESSIASSALKIKNNKISRYNFLESKGEKGFQLLLNVCSEKCLKNAMENFSSHDSNNPLEYFERDSAIEDLELVSRLYGLRRLLISATSETLRIHCGVLGVSKSGDTHRLTKTITNHFFKRQYREKKILDRKNVHPSDLILDGIAFVNRDKNEPVSIEFLGTAWNLRRICVKICSYGEEPKMDKDKDRYWDEHNDPKKKDLEEEEKVRVLPPIFAVSDLLLGRHQLEMANMDINAVKDESWVESTRKKIGRKLKKSFGIEDSFVFGLSQLVQWIESVQPNSDQIKRVSEMGLISFRHLAHSMPTLSLVTTVEHDLRSSTLAFLVVDTNYKSRLEDHPFLPRTKIRKWNFEMSVASIHSTGSSFVYSVYNSIIPQFDSEVSKSLLPYQTITESLKASLSHRGEKYVKYSKGNQFVCHGEESFVIHHQVYVKAGRMMLDIDTGRSNGEYSGYSNRSNQRKTSPGRSAKDTLTKYFNKKSKQSDKDDSKKFSFEMETVPTDLLCICWPAIVAFSFTFKQWGYVLINNVQDIKWNDRAFDQLVLEQGRKDLIHAVVKNTEKISSDIIDGKGGGSIILLHGPPGTGKTLTAEAVSEMLHKPLYYVSVGELGTTPRDLERKLNEILELSLTWKSILLMDEADIFLEQRGHHEIERNAMVAVIIKKLEYFQGILFLTSNRVASFDLAFYSRITIALRYGELDMKSRSSVWAMLFDLHGIKDLDPNLFSEFPLNGRQIKNCIALSQGLASVNQRSLTVEDVMQTVLISANFMESMNKLKRLKTGKAH